uniref:EMAP like 3 n=1 Tax=Taeniopygia guttata TaxID=59729 RepID=A0A674HRD8_TAEGU
MFLRGRPITMYVPSGLGPLRAELPPERLQLDWVYGYRGRDSRSNLHVLGSGELVYFIACVVVLLQLPARRQRHYLRHSDCVRCLAVHPDRLRVATGQAAGVDKDGKPLQPIVYIWDSATLQTLQQIGLGSFERGVGSLAFSTADQGAFLCVVDDSNEHMMSVWDCARGTKQAEVKSTNESVLTVEFNPRDSSSIVSSGKSHVFFWSWSGGALTKKHGIFGKYKKPKFIQCFIFDAAGALLTGDSEGNILTWTRTPGKGGKEMYQIGQQTRAHEGSVFALCRRRDGTVLSGGGKDRRVLSWSPTLELLHEVELPESFGAVRTIAEGPGEELLVGTTRNALLRGTLGSGFTPIVQGHTDEVWGLATHPNCCRFLTCGHDRQLCLWDGREHALAWSLALEDTGLCADFHPGGHVVAVGLLSGRWLVLDTGTRQLLAGGSDGNEQLSVVRFSPDGTFLAIGSHDNFIYIYSVAEGGRKFSRFGRCTGHSSFITHLDWSKDGRFIMSNSGDYEILYWDVAGGCKLLRNRFESRDREWASYTCVLGFHVFVTCRPSLTGSQSRVRRARQPRDQRALHARRRPLGVAGREGHQRLPVAGAARGQRVPERAETEPRLPRKVPRSLRKCPRRRRTRAGGARTNPAIPESLRRCPNPLRRCPRGLAGGCRTSPGVPEASPEVPEGLRTGRAGAEAAGAAMKRGRGRARG